MGQSSALAVSSVLERGSVVFLFRPRVDERETDELDDMQRVLIHLAPEGSRFERLIAAGKTRMDAASTLNGRFWGFVDLVLTHHDMTAALGAHMYGTKSSGLRHLPAATAFAEGIYEIVSDGLHSHLHWWVERNDEDEIAREIAIERDAEYIVTIANPDAAAWGLLEPPDLQARLFDELESHVTLPAPFPEPLKRRFRGRRLIELDSPGWLDHPGAELIFIGAGR